MSDIFREVEEDVRKERLEKWWKAYGDYVIALLALMIVGIAGFELWQRYEESQKVKASTDYVSAQQMTNPTQAAAAFAALSKTAPGGYGILSRLEQANALVLAGRTQEALAAYKDIAANDNGPIGATARIRAGWLIADTASRADLEALLQPVNNPTSAWRQMAEEILAYSDYKAGKTAAAATAFDALARDPDSPDALKSRTRAFADFLHAGGAVDYGTVPAAAATPEPGVPPGVGPRNVPPGVGPRP